LEHRTIKACYLFEGELDSVFELQDQQLSCFPIDIEIQTLSALVWGIFLCKIRSFVIRIMNMPTVSVVIPAFNVEKFILNTIDSILNQTQCVEEIIVVEDHSTDNTAHLLRQHFSDSAKVKIITNAENKGLCASRNIGINAVKKCVEYIMLVDADDLIAPYAVEMLSKALLRSQPSFGLAFGSLLAINEQNIVIHHAPPIQAPDNITLKALAERNLIGSGSGALVNKSVFSDGIEFEESLRDKKLEGCCDWLFYLLVRSRYDIKYIDMPTVGYRVIDGSMSSDTVRMLKSLVKVQSLAAQSISMELDESFREGYLYLSVLYSEQAIGNRNFSKLIEVLAETRNYSNTMFLSTLNRIVKKKLLTSFRRIKGINHRPTQPAGPDFYHYCAQHCSSSQGHSK